MGAGAGAAPRPWACRQPALSVLAQVNEQLAGERGSLAQVLRQEFADRLAASEEENRQVRAELAALRARQQLELEQLAREKQAELEAVHGRWVPAGPGASGSTRGPRAGEVVAELALQAADAAAGGSVREGPVTSPPGHSAPGPPAWLERVLCKKGGSPTRATTKAHHTPGTPPSFLVACLAPGPPTAGTLRAAQGRGPRPS